MDRKRFKLPIRSSGFTLYPCPSCGRGYLKVKKESLVHNETKESIDYFRSDDSAWPGDKEFVFSCIFICTESGCQSHISSSGVGYLEEDRWQDEDGNWDSGFVHYFEPKHFYPHLWFFRPPKKTPDNVLAEIKKSFSLFFTDESSAANHLRVAIEHLLDSLGIKKTIDRKKPLTLHRRIELLPQKYGDVRESLFAIKWLGNSGSHRGKVLNRDDVLDAYELMEDALNELYVGHKKKIMKMRKRINKKKGPK